MDADYESNAQEIRRYIGQRIAHARKVAGLSQEQLANQLANYTGEVWSRIMITKMETGLKRIDVETLCAVAIVQDRAVGWYFQDAPSSLRDTIPGLLGLAPEDELEAA